ncbi:MAG: carboxypeptidase-like regulatory domain-containing protein [bacterium]
MDIKYTKSTDTEHKIKLDSELVYAAWRCGAAPAGGTAPLEVETSFVGNGAEIKIKGRSEKGKNLGSTEGKVRNNKFIGALDIPEDAEIGDEAYFEVRLSKNGLSGESNRIPIVHPINVTNMRWSAEEARRGDVLTLSAKVTGVRDNTEGKITIFEYDRDSVHDNIVELPVTVMDKKIEIDWEYEYHEDTDEIPTDEEMDRYGRSYNPPEYFFVVEINGQRFGQNQESGLLTFKDWIEIRLHDAQGNPIANARYILYLPDGQEKEGNLDGDGFAREDGIPPGRYAVEFPDIDEHRS